MGSLNAQLRPVPPERARPPAKRVGVGATPVPGLIAEGLLLVGAGVGVTALGAWGGTKLFKRDPIAGGIGLAALSGIFVGAPLVILGGIVTSLGASGGTY